MSFNRNAAIAFAAVAALSLSILSLRDAPPAKGAQWLVNGSFEDGTTGWDITGVPADGCAPRSGSGVAAFAVNDDVTIMNQTINGPFSPGTYRFSGYGRIASGGTPTMVATMRLLDGLTFNRTNVTVGGGYALWSVEMDFAVQVSGVRVGVTLFSETDAVVCFDDLSFEGPLSSPPPANTPTSTATAPAGSTATAVPSSTSAPSSTATAAAATPTPFLGFQFINGGFEDATSGWRTNGGEIDAVANPRRSGNAAGRYSSHSESTKWVYQIVAIDAAQAYEFQGALLTEGAVAEAYLRISWYQSSDGSGSQISTDDSTSRIGANSGGFAFLTTGPVQPPPEARSARVRVMLAPASGSPGHVYLDDFALVASAPVTPTATATTAATSTGTAVAQTPVSTQAAPQGVPANESTGTPAQGSTAEVAGVRSTASSSLAAAGQIVTSTPRARPSTGAPTAGEGEPDAVAEDGPLWPYLVAVPAAALFVAGGYFFGKRLKAI